ncbi:hypothetical protein D3C87_1091850 [compost metagenome]
MLGTACGDRKRFAATLDDIAHGFLPTRSNADVEACCIQPHVGAHDPRHLDVADAVVHGVGVVHPVLLHQHTLHAQVGGDRSNLAGLVGLDAADRHQGVAALIDGFGNQVFELACLVPAEGQATVAIFTFGIQLHLAAQVFAEAFEGRDRRWTEGQRITFEAIQVHGVVPYKLRYPSSFSGLR